MLYHDGLIFHLPDSKWTGYLHSKSGKDCCGISSSCIVSMWG